MDLDRGLEATRAVRGKISHAHGNEPRRLIEYYLAYQTRFAKRLRRAPAGAAASEDAEPSAAADGATRRG